MADVCRAVFPQTKEEKIAFALSHRIAVWDVLSGCEICGADDSSIRNPVPNDMSLILERADIQAVFATGTKAGARFTGSIARRRPGFLGPYCCPRAPGKLPDPHMNSFTKRTG